jgi:hypothetical protein
MTAEERKEQIIKSLRNLHSDQSVDITQTLDFIAEIRDEADSIIGALECDIQIQGENK